MAGTETARRNGPAEPPAKVRWLRGMILGTIGIVLALALAWFVPAYALPLWQAHSAIRSLEREFEHGAVSLNDACSPVIKKLGGERAAARKLALYLRCVRPTVERRMTISHILERCFGGNPVEGLVLLARDQELDPDVRAFMVHLLSDEHGSPESVTPLIDLLRTDPAAEVRAAAARELPFLMYRDRASEVVTALIEALRDKDEDVRSKAAWSLGGLGSIAQVVETLEHLKEDPEVGSCAKEALWYIECDKKDRARPAEVQSRAPGEDRP
jgi:hypothetical protein